MADSDRDQRGRLPSGKRCPDSQAGGCNYCITGTCKRAARRVLRRSKRAQIREES